MPKSRVRKKSQMKGGVLYRKPIYKNMGGPVLHHQTGGTVPATIPGAVTLPHLPGVEAHEAVNTAIAGGNANVVDTTGKTGEQIRLDALAASANPALQPDYYGGATVAEFDPQQIEAFRQKEQAAKDFNDLTAKRQGVYESYLDPNSAAQQQAQQSAANVTSGAFYGAGTPGSARGAQATSAAAQQAQQNLEARGLAGLQGVQRDLTGGADILADIGAERQAYVQNVINEDIKRWNFAQLSPQNQIDALLAYANELEAQGITSSGEIVAAAAQAAGVSPNIIHAATSSTPASTPASTPTPTPAASYSSIPANTWNPTSSTASNFGASIGGLFGDLLSGFSGLNQGGEVMYKQDGGQIPQGSAQNVLGQPFERQLDIYGNPVAIGGIRNYRMPYTGGGAGHGVSAEQACAQKGGVWDPVARQCILGGRGGGGSGIGALNDIIGCSI